MIFPYLFTYRTRNKVEYFNDQAYQIICVIGCEDTGECYYEYSTCWDYTENPPVLEINEEGYLGPVDREEGLCSPLELILDPDKVTTYPDGTITIEPHESPCHAVCY